MTAYISTGITVGFSTLSGELLDVNHGGETADTVETTHQLSTSGWKTFLASLKDAGEITLTVHFGGTVPATGTSASLVVTWPSGLGTYTCAAILTNKGIAAPLGDKMTQDLTFKLSGVPS